MSKHSNRCVVVRVRFVFIMFIFRSVVRAWQLQSGMVGSTGWWLFLSSARVGVPVPRRSYCEPCVSFLRRLLGEVRFTSVQVDDSVVLFAVLLS